MEALSGIFTYLIRKKEFSMAITQTAAEMAVQQTTDQEDLAFSREELAGLRRLAARTAELANRPVEEEKKKIWYALNALKPVRPVIFCDPENGWNEIILPNTLTCRNPLARQWEMTLRKEIFWGEKMGDDRVIEPYFNVGYVYYETGWGMHTKIGGQNGGSYRWESPLTDYSMLKDLSFSKIIINHARTRARLDLAQKIFGDCLTVRLKGAWWWTMGLTWEVIKLRGLEQFMLDMYDHPEDLHRLMAFMRDGHLAKLDFLEQNGLLSGF